MHRVLRNFAWMTAASIASQALGAVAIILVTRRLGPTVFGMLAMAQAIANLGLTVADMGLGRLGTRRVANGEGSNAGANLVVLRTGLNLVLLGLIWLGSLLAGVSRTETALVILSALATTGLALAPDFVWAGLQRLETYSKVQLLQQSLRATGIAGAVLLTGSALSVPLVTLAAGMLGALLLWVLLPNESRRLRLNPAGWGPSLLTAMPIGLAAMMSDIYINTDSLMVRGFLGFRALGQYAAAYRLLLIALTVGGLFVASIFPELCRVRAPDKRNGIVSGALLLCLTGAIPLAMAAVLLPSGITQLVYGSTYREAAVAVTPLLLTPVLALPNLVLSSALVAMGDAAFNLGAIAAGGVVNLGLDALLLPAMGIKGAALATLTAEAAVLAGLLWRLRPHIQAKSAVHLAAGGLAATTAMIALRDLPVVIPLVAGCALYGVCLLLLRFPRQIGVAWRGTPALEPAHG